MSCYEGNLEAARYLLSLDADPNSAHTAGGGNTPLHEAARGGSLEATLLLLKSSANVIAANSHGDLPLHVACRHGRVDIARRLLAHDRDDDWTTVTARNHAGLTPADVVHGCAALSSLLEQVHISLTAEDGDDAPATAGAGAAGSRSRSRERSSSSHRSSSKSRGAADHGLGNSGGGRRGDHRRGGGSREKRGIGIVPMRRIDHKRPLLSGSALPRLVRLPRPLGAGGGGGRGGGGGGALVPLEGETPSIAGCSASGTSYGASLTESDFAIPAATAPEIGVDVVGPIGRRGAGS